MNLGLLDLPAPLLGAIDGALAWLGLPAFLRVIGWGLLGGAIGMWLYRRYSPQQRISEVRDELRGVQKQLADYDGEFSGLRSLIKRQFGLVLIQLRLTFGGALLAGVPVLLILPWLSNTFDARFPAVGEAVPVCASPTAAGLGLAWQGATVSAGEREGCWTLQWPVAGQSAQLLEGETRLLDVPLAVPARIVHRRTPLNWVVGNPAGYLPDAAQTRAVTMSLPSRELIAIGPGWLRGWEAAFFSAALLVSLWLRARWRLH